MPNKSFHRKPQRARFPVNSTLGINEDKQEMMYKITLVAVSLAITSYFLCFFATTDIFLGQFQGDEMDFRLFKSKSHYMLFLPLIKVEEFVKTREKDNYYFYGHINNGASLPPPRHN